MELLKKIFSTPELQNEPPILIDIGASGTIHKKWKNIAEYCICIAFDADDREFGYIEKKSSGFKKLYIYNCIVSDQEKSKIDFFLTKSPYCSSTLEPDNHALEEWAFADKFKVEKKIALNNISLSKVLADLNLSRVDWFKTDSQGTDLRLFKNLPEEVQNKVIVAEFEPGLIDSYKGEDKLYEVLKYMSDKNFWISDFVIKGTQRLKSSLLGINKSELIKKLLSFSHRSTPGWGEITFINTLKNASLRELYLGWVFAIIHKQYGFALDIAKEADKQFNNTLIKEMIKYSSSKITSNMYKFSFTSAVIEKISKSIK